ncbi:MAG: gliding motility-associated C-terminal domain-containing protein [Flavobacteriales bacterium]|nr:gliding motility-associated C-terminal domain-containing protein [Flavobacteriales bacterium]
MSEPSVTACQGAFLDSNGNGGPYDNNENFTTVICPDGSGPAISLQWVIFNLSTAGVAPADQMSIYDGDNTSAPLIGTWSGGDSPGIISASFANPTGCLTLVFTSNNTGTGDFAANITCFQPCEPPTAVATFNSPIPLLACQDEVITFDASASFAAAGFTVTEYNWDYADGTTATGPIVQHAFTDPAEYVVQVEVIDDNGCSSLNLVDLQVLVSTTPIFTGTTPSTTICQGESVSLTTDPTAITWSALPESNLGSGIFLPDLQGVPFSTSITFTQFSPGQTLTNPLDLLSVCATMEHSYMGDLVIQISCPNGQTTVMHQQGGGGTYIGVPVDNEGTPNVQGECWEYCWSPTATNGTWEDNSGGTVPAGTYESVQPFSNLIGCPLNGVWTFTVTDLFAIDNGYLCDWSLTFNPALFPSLTVYTPNLGQTADSAVWSGANLVNDPNNPFNATVAGVTPGVFDYTFTITDNFGCTYDTTITVTVTPSPQGPINISGNPVVCSGGLASLSAPAGFDTYVWQPGNLFGPNVQVGVGTYTVTVAYGNCPLTSDPITVTAAPNPAPVITGPSFSCGGALAVLSTTEPYEQYTWSNEATTPSITVGTGAYTVTVTNAEGCTGTSAPFNVQVGSSPVAAFTFTPPSPQPMNTTVDFTDLSTVTGSTIVGWEWDFGGQGGSDVQNPSWTFGNPFTYNVVLIVTAADGCTDTVSTQYLIFPPDITIPNVISPNGDQSNDYFVIRNIEFWSNELSIYSRWGNKVYDVKNYRNQWKADDLPDGTYYYVLRLNDGQEHAGHITVLR